MAVGWNLIRQRRQAHGSDFDVYRKIGIKTDLGGTAMVTLKAAHIFIFIGLIAYFTLVVQASGFIDNAFFRLSHIATRPIGMRCGCKAAVTYRKN